MYMYYGMIATIGICGVFLMVGLGWCVWGGERVWRDEELISSHWDQGACHQHDLSLWCWPQPPCWGGAVRCLLCKASLFPLPMPYPLEGSNYLQPTPRGGGSCFPLRAEHPHRLFGIPLLGKSLLPPFIYLSNLCSVSMDPWVFILHVGLQSNTTLLISLLKLSQLRPWELVQLALVSLSHISWCVPLSPSLLSLQGAPSSSPLSPAPAENPPFPYVVTTACIYIKLNMSLCRCLQWETYLPSSPSICFIVPFQVQRVALEG